MGVMYGVDQSTGAIGDPVLDSSTGSGGGGGLTQQEHEWLEDIHDARFLLPNLEDVNRDKQLNNHFYYSYTGPNKSRMCDLLVQGYDVIYLYCSSNRQSDGGVYYTFYDKDLQVIGSEVRVTSYSNWLKITIPDDAYLIYIAGNSVVSSASYTHSIYYALFVNDPDNQNP